MLVRVNALALITGGSRGIGRGIALELSRLGCDLVINCVRNLAAAEKTAAECVATAQGTGHTIRAEVFQADIGQCKDRESLIQFVKSKFGRLDVLVNNAGVAPEVRADLLDADEASFDRVLNINLKGPYFLTQLAARYMLEQIGNVPPGPFGRKIITISSISAYAASINRGDYCVAKAGLAMLTPLYAARLAKHGINVYEIRPGIVETEMTQPVKEKYNQLIAAGLTPIKRWGTPQDVGLAVAAITQDLLPFSTGQVIDVDGGFHIHRL
jgi:NAD(P)-dependent dehydrogenase (short-subunit alcohol dehydrogenase family)